MRNSAHGVDFPWTAPDFGQVSLVCRRSEDPGAVWHPIIAVRNVEHQRQLVLLSAVRLQVAVRAPDAARTCVRLVQRGHDQARVGYGADHLEARNRRCRGTIRAR
jgi:hypothetical protein